MRIIVRDSSCLIDIRQASSLDAFLKLPSEILIPNTLFEDELRSNSRTFRNVRSFLAASRSSTYPATVFFVRARRSWRTSWARGLSAGR